MTRDRLVHHLSATIFDGSYDSMWWEAERGRPPIHVLIGIWMADAVFAIGITLVVGAIVCVVLMFVGQ